MGLRLKFNLVLVLGLLAIALLAIYFQQQQINFQYQKHLKQQAEHLFQLSEDIRLYTEDEIAPKLNQLDQGFLPQSSGSYAATEILNDHSMGLHQVALLNAQLPRYQANAWQRDLINTFKNQPSLPALTAHLKDANGPFYVLAKPINTNQDISGIKLIKIQTLRDKDQLNNTFNQFIVEMLVVAVFILLLVNLIMHFLLFKPLSTLVVQSQSISRGEATIEQVLEPSGYELLQISQAFNRLQRSLKAAMNLLS